MSKAEIKVVGQNEALVDRYRQEVKLQTNDQQTVEKLLGITFRGFDLTLMRTAMLEGRMRGFEIKDFFQKDVYAIKYGKTYNLVTSINHSRKLGMQGGVVGKSLPVYKYKDDGGILSCSVTIKRKVDDYIGEFSAEVFFDEYYQKGKTYADGRYVKSMWDKKPHTMIAKVAEMHALRQACPEKLSQHFVEEEFQQGVVKGEYTDITDQKKIAKRKTVKEIEADIMQEIKNQNEIDNLIALDENTQKGKLSKVAKKRISKAVKNRVDVLENEQQEKN